jgi:hypothetical protein
VRAQVSMMGANRLKSGKQISVLSLRGQTRKKEKEKGSDFRLEQPSAQPPTPSPARTTCSTALHVAWSSSCTCHSRWPGVLLSCSSCHPGRW